MQNLPSEKNVQTRLLSKVLRDALFYEHQKLNLLCPGSQEEMMYMNKVN